jgi:GDPmannose 4,6-dehydratase
MKVALITGITGQDGSYLAELLLGKEYKVYGIMRRHSTVNGTSRIDKIFHKLIMKYGDVTDAMNIQTIFNEIEIQNPTMERFEIYNLAAQSHVKVSFELPLYTAEVDALGTLRILNAIINSSLKEKIRFYQASTSELYGDVLETPQTENTPFNPQSPYAVAKLYSYWILKNYQKSHGLYLCNGILFNHTSSRRGDTFVCKKICNAVEKIMKGEQETLYLGNLNAKRDIGHAKDYVYGMWLMLQQDEPDEFVLATGKTYSIREMVEMAFRVYNKKIIWKDEGVNEFGTVDGKVVCRVDTKYFRATEVQLLLGDATKAKNKLNWMPTIYLPEIIQKILTHND